MRWVADACVVVKWLAPEEDSDVAATLLGDELLVPDMVFSECMNVLWKKVSRQQIAADVALAGIGTLQATPLIVFVSEALMAEALDLAFALSHPAYDCFYLALAKRENVPLVTADKKLFNRCQQPDAAWLKPYIRLLGAHERS